MEVWDEDRSHPVRSYSWGADSVHAVKFNYVEVFRFDKQNPITFYFDLWQTNILAGCAADRSIFLYDIRQANPLRKVGLHVFC